MTEDGGWADAQSRAGIPRSRLADYAEMVEPAGKNEHPGDLTGVPPAEPTRAPTPMDDTASTEDPLVAERRREFEALLEEFRATPVLVPLGEAPGPDDERGLMTADLNGIRFILAFSDQQALARYAQARGEFRRKWTYQTILGARLLDVAVPAAGVPCGVALDCADGSDGAIFPPVKGIVPEEAAVDGDMYEYEWDVR
ncbi:hypothetical protein ACFT9I_21460 [Streptomyces sp. NPDC057137]|uniref:hypothetical protein n=1 Tax=Streptomyces sp. NPDC057137 TaxID=3346030 RepID=UPI003629D4AD